MSRGLGDLIFDRKALSAIFFERLNYEDNAQYYLIWSVLAKRTGGSPDMRTVGRAYRFIREHELAFNLIEGWITNYLFFRSLAFHIQTSTRYLFHRLPGQKSCSL
jgi:hypothetical protein